MANMAPQSVIEVGAANILRAIVTGYMLGLFKYRSDPMKSSHFHMKEKIAQVTRAGTIYGMIMRIKISR